MKEDLKSYLNKEHSFIDIDDEKFQGLSMLDSKLDSKDIFLAGENHGVEANVKLRMMFLKYFKERTNFKYYLCELPYSMTSTLNRYLESGDEEILANIYKALKGTDAWNKDDYRHWIDLYRFNKGLSKEDKIVAIGIDIEHQPKNAFLFMDYILKKRNITEKIKSYTEEAKNKESFSDGEVKSFYEKIKEEMVKDEEKYKKLLGEDYFSIMLVNNNLLNMLDVYGGNNFAGIRDRKMSENFQMIFKTLNGGKYFGQMGLSHVFQESFPYVDWFASSLNKEESKFKGKVLSIAYAYRDCKYLYPTRRKNYVGTINTLERSIKELDELLDSPLTLFALDEEGSPFREKLIWPLEHKNPLKGVTSDYFQYLLVIKDSKEMEAFPIHK